MVDNSYSNIRTKNYVIFFIFFFIVACIGFSAGACFFIIHNQSIDFSSLSHNTNLQPSIVLDDEGNEWARFWFDKREPVPLTTMPQHLINAFIASEDREFFVHYGISWKGIIRSFLVNLYNGRKVQGASTITQQLVKLLFFDNKKTFTRKIKEQCASLLVELHYTKNEILQTYLNNVCFGCGIYGVEAAAQRFWSKHAHELTVGESALLAGIIAAPARYCPLQYPLSAQRRRNIVLRKMHWCAYLTETDYSNARNEPVVLSKRQENCIAPHVKEMVRIDLEELVGKDLLYTGGLTIYTTINKKMQEAAYTAFINEVTRIKHALGSTIDGGLLAIDTNDGAIKALVGGFSFLESKFNRPIQARRQVGSCFKPIAYAAALTSGLHFTDTEVDEPFIMKQSDGTCWEPHNFDGKFRGIITRAYALSHSNNIVSIKTLLTIGAQPVVELAKLARFKGPLHYYPSLALGAIDGTLYEVAGMFNIFANDGIYVKPYYIALVKDKWGAKIYRQTHERERILSSTVVGQVASVLRLGPERIRSGQRSSQWVDCDVISKTGTTNDCTTCWYVGATPALTTAIYVGHDDNRPMGKNVYPVQTALPIWRSFNCTIENPKKQFFFDPSLREIVINEYTGELSDVTAHNSIKILVEDTFVQSHK